MKKLLSKVEIYAGIGIIVSLTLLLCSFLVKHVIGEIPTLLYNVAMIILIISMILLLIYFVMCVVEMIRDLYCSIKNRRNKK